MKNGEPVDESENEVSSLSRIGPSGGFVPLGGASSADVMPEAQQTDEPTEQPTVAQVSTAVRERVCQSLWLILEGDEAAAYEQLLSVDYNEIVAALDGVGKLYIQLTARGAAYILEREFNAGSPQVGVMSPLLIP